MVHRSTNVLDLVKISSAEGRSHISSLFTKEDGTPVAVRYVDKKRIQNWLNVNRLQLPLHNHIMDSTRVTMVHDESTDSSARYVQDVPRSPLKNSIPQIEENASGKSKIMKSLGEDLAPIGNYNVRGKDIALEEIAPVQQGAPISQQAIKKSYEQSEDKGLYQFVVDALAGKLKLNAPPKMVHRSTELI